MSVVGKKIELFNINKSHSIKNIHSDFEESLIAFSSTDKKLLISIGKSNQITFWNILTGKIITHISNFYFIPRGSYGLYFSPNGKKIACGFADSAVREYGIMKINKNHVIFLNICLILL